MSRGTNLALTVNTVEEVNTQEPYRTSWSMYYPENLEYHYNDHMAFHAKTFWVDPSKAKEDNTKRNNSSGFKSSGPRTRSCYNCGDKNHFIAQCPYEHRETHGGRLIPKENRKDPKAPNKKFYNKSKKDKRPSRIVLVTKEEYSSDEVESISDEEETSKEVAAIATTNIPSSSLFESPNENPHIKNAHCFMARSSLDTSIVLSTQEEYTSGDDDDDEEDETSNGLVALASLSNNSSSPRESPNEDIQVKEESCLMDKSFEVSSPNPSMPNISNDLGVDHASLKVNQEMLDFDEFILNLQGDTKRHVSNLMIRLAQLDDTLDKKCQMEREDSLEIHALKNALEEGQETIASLEERLEILEEPQDEINKLTKDRDLARAKDLDELDKAHKALKSEYSLLSKSNKQHHIRLASYDVPSSSTSSCDHANLVEENARLKDELAKASSPQGKLSLDDLLSKQRSNNRKEGIGFNAKAKKANKKKAKSAQEKKKAITNGASSSLATASSDLESLRSAYQNLETRLGEADKKRERAEKQLAEKKTELIRKEADFAMKRKDDSDTLQNLKNKVHGLRNYMNTVEKGWDLLNTDVMEPLGYDEDRRNQFPRDDLIRLAGDDCKDLISASWKICHNLNIKESRTCDVRALIKRMDLLPELVVDLQASSPRDAAQMSLAMCLPRSPGLDIDLATSGVPLNTDVDALLDACSGYDTRIARRISHIEFFDKVVLPVYEVLEAEYAKERAVEARPAGSGDEGQMTWTSSKDKSKDGATSPTKEAEDDDEDAISSPAKEAEDEAAQAEDGTCSSPAKEK
ncbi:hypothetical protein QYE76_053569 [Lolium multiflorum]|uniref:CCHC-type domain-containing protein n=1 Tax=Lolium multiflorum TaxID=4521 RepID=A0AAD8WMN8_LOLMU|nr:hypothetical protein QYE76_053569 [Lolium multiflorum]